MYFYGFKLTFFFADASPKLQLLNKETSVEMTDSLAIPLPETHPTSDDVMKAVQRTLLKERKKNKKRIKKLKKKIDSYKVNFNIIFNFCFQL